MSEYKIPQCIIDGMNKEPSRLLLASREYEKLYGKTWFTEGLYYDDDEIADILETCVKEGKTFAEIVGDDGRCEENEDI